VCVCVCVCVCDGLKTEAVVVGVVTNGGKQACTV